MDPGSEHRYQIGFLMDQVAGHITNYRNLRRVTDRDGDIAAEWCEISYYREGGAIERTRERYLRFVPTYVSGNARAALEISRGLRDRQYDAIFTNAKAAVLFARKFGRTPTVVDYDATPLQLDAMPAYGGGADPKPVAHLKWRLCRDLFRSASLLQAWSRWAKQSAVEDYGVSEDKVVVNPPGVDLAFWGGAERRAPTAGPRSVLFVGGDFRRKGGELLLEWHRRQPVGAVELHLVTKEPVEPRPGVFVYDDLQPNTPALLERYRQADVFALPSLGECFGIATVEAMAAGLPVVASDVGGTADIIEQGQNGFITAAGDVDDLGAALAAVLADPARRDAMGRRSRQLAEERFDVERNARRTLDLLKGLAGGDQPEPAAAPVALAG
jgi:glycosyltransferase involved in cell wall biosynthesis